MSAMTDPAVPLVTAIAKALNTAGVPCVLWGKQLLNVYGVPSIADSIAFIISDVHLHTGIKVLTTLELLSCCTEGELCSASPQQCCQQPAAFHFHIKEYNCLVSLYSQSKTLWFLPPLDQSLSSPLKQRLPSYFLLATDNEHLPKSRPGRGYGAFPSEEYSVLVPSAPVFLEALMRIYARASETRVMISARTEIIYIFQYVDPDGFLDEESLPEPFRSSYRELKAAVKPVRQWAQDLRDALEEHDKNRQQDNSGFQAISI